MLSGAMLLRKNAPLETTQLTLKANLVTSDIKYWLMKMISKAGEILI